MQRNNIHIILDYGHGAPTNGKMSPKYDSFDKMPNVPINISSEIRSHIEFGHGRYYEYLSNRIIGRQIYNELVKLGYYVHETVSNNTDPSLTERVRRTNEICKKFGASNCIFISIHSNAAGNATKWMTARGWCAYTTKGQNNSDKLATCMYEFADKYFKEDKMTIRKDISDKDPDWEANFTVIKGANCVAVLTESFFYDNIDDLRYIISERGQKQIVKVHVDGIESYVKKYKGVV